MARVSPPITSSRRTPANSGLTLFTRTSSWRSSTASTRRASTQASTRSRASAIRPLPAVRSPVSAPRPAMCEAQGSPAHRCPAQAVVPARRTTRTPRSPAPTGRRSPRRRSRARPRPERPAVPSRTRTRRCFPHLRPGPRRSRTRRRRSRTGRGSSSRRDTSAASTCFASAMPLAPSYSTTACRWPGVGSLA